MKPQSTSAWAICSDSSGVLVHTISRTRIEAIGKFVSQVEWPWSMSDWRRYRRRGWRASHVSIQEHLFGKPAKEQDQ